MAATPGKPSSAAGTDGEQTLGLDKNQSNLYTSARQHTGSPPSPAPDRPPERKGAGGVAAGTQERLGVALFAWLYCSKG